MTRSLRITLAASFLASITLASCTPSAARGDVTGNDPMNIGVVVYPGSAPYLIAEKKDFFRKHGVNAHVVVSADLTQAMAALGSDAIQFFYSSADFVTVIKAAGIDMKEIYTTDVGDGADGLLVTSDVNSVDDLKGKTVYLAVGTPSHFLFRTVAAEHGLRPADIKLVKMEADQVGAAFAAGKLDVGMTWEPWLTKAAAERSGGKRLFTSHDAPGVIADTLVVRTDTLKSDPQKTEAVLAALFEAVEWWKANPQEGNVIAAEGLGITVDEFVEQANTVRFLSPEENMRLFDRAVPRNLYALTEAASDIFVTDGVLATPVDADEIVDPSVMQSYLNNR